MYAYVLLIVGFIFLIKGADVLVEGAAAIARRFNISNLVIGLTVVAFGTSAPELGVNVIAGLKGNTELAVGNILGSNIANILLILGVCATIRPLSVHANTVWREIPFALLAVLIVSFIANDALLDGAASSSITRIDGLVLISFFVIFLYYTFVVAMQGGVAAKEEIRHLGAIKSVAFVAVGLVGLVMGGEAIVRGATHLALRFGLSQSVIGLTVVAIGTSLPELAASAVAAYRRQSDIAIGNVVGSNIFNIFWILGVSASIRPLPFNARNNIDVSMAIIASLLLFAALFVGERRVLKRWQGSFFITVYILYIIFSIVKDTVR